MTGLLLYGHPGSGQAGKVALALALAGLPHRTRWDDIWADPATRPAAFLTASPFAEVPLLMIDSVAHLQSGAILPEIASRFRCLGGETPEGKQRGRELPLSEANRIGMCLPQLKDARRVNGQGFPAGALDWLRLGHDKDCARFAMLPGGGPFFHGQTPGIGDCAIWGYTQWLDAAGVEPTPVMSELLARMRALPALNSPVGFFSSALA